MECEKCKGTGFSPMKHSTPAIEPERVNRELLEALKLSEKLMTADFVSFGGAGLEPEPDSALGLARAAIARAESLAAASPTAVDPMTDTMIHVIQRWLDWQEKERAEEGLGVDDDTHIYSVPHWPSRGQFKAWIAHLKSLAAAGVGGVPAGWKLVPIEPTHNQCRSGELISLRFHCDANASDCKTIYEAMIDAAPEMRKEGGEGNYVKR